MTFAKNFGQCHVFYFLDSHFHLLGYQIAAVSPISLLVTDGMQQLCLKSVAGRIQHEGSPHSACGSSQQAARDTGSSSAAVTKWAPIWN